MTRLFVLLAIVAPTLLAWTEMPSLQGVITDPSGSAVPAAVVQLSGHKRNRDAITDGAGHYSFLSLAPGTYEIRVTARSFAPVRKRDFTIDRAMVFNAQLAIESGKEVVTVSDDVARVGTHPDSNGSLVLREKQLAALSDDPDELALQLQALAGPAPGPNGGQMYIDGFTGSNLPPKFSIREVRINSNPFSPEYDKPGFARIEVFTKPGSGALRGQAFLQYNNQALNSRNPLVAQSAPPYRARFYGFDFSGPLNRNRSSFAFALERRNIGDNALILATTLDANLNPVTINQSLSSPQSRTAISPRLDYALNPRNALLIRYQDVRIALDNQGAGDFNLASRAYSERQTEHTVQATETATLTPKLIDETRFQFSRSLVRQTPNEAGPTLNVQGAFVSGGATAGNSKSVTDGWELANIAIFTRSAHTFKWGGRVRQSLLTDTSLNNFAGSFTFFTLDQYRRTLAGVPGAVPSQFSLNIGNPTSRLKQLDAGLFANDDWRARPNLTLSFGVRYEAQTHLGDRTDWAPRIGLAWSPGGRSNQPAKTVLRAGFGFFHDRLPLSTSLNALRFDGSHQRSYLIPSPTFFPAIPPADVLQAGAQPQLLQPVYSGLVAPRLYQSSLGIERQINRYARINVNWIDSRGVHLFNARNVNAPVDSVSPFGDPSIRLLTESAGLSRQHQLIVTPSLNYRKLTLSGYYALSSGRDNNEGAPADPYNLRAEWGPSSYGDVRHRMVLSTAIPLPWHFSVMPFLAANSGLPYNIRTGLDPNNTGFPAQRPALSATGFDLNPAPGTPVIERNSGRGPAAVNLAGRVSRTWLLGRRELTLTSSDNRKQSLTLSASTLNALNHPNYAPPDGNLSSPYFGRYRSLGGLVVMSHGGASSAYNRKIDVQLRFTF